MPTRILITGSRDYRKPGMADAIFRAIRGLGGDDRHVTIAHGGASGADALAATAAAVHGFDTDVDRAEWTGPCQLNTADPLTDRPWCTPGHRQPRRGGGSYCPRAGNRRNQRLVDAGADICLAFPLPASTGTWDCVRRAVAAGIPVRVHHPDGRVDTYTDPTPTPDGLFEEPLR